MVVKTSKKVLSIVLAVVLLASVVVMSGATSLYNVKAASGDTVYLEAPSDWSAPNCYMWIDSSTNNAKWPGVAMTNVEGNIWSYELDKDYTKIIFNNGGAQTDDMDYPGADQIYNQGSGSWSEYTAASSVSVSVSQKDGTSFKDTLSVDLKLKNATSGTYSIDGGKAISFTDSKTVVMGQGLKGGLSTTLTVTAQGEESYTKTYTYKKSFRAPSGGTSGDDGHTTEAVGGKYATNPNNQYGGKGVTISSASDWKESMIIAQGVANDDANVFKGPHEYPVYDTYTLYGAWDNDNLYIGWQFVNVRDITASDQGGAGTNEAKPYNADMPQMIALDLGRGLSADGPMDTGKYVWGETIDFTTNVDALMAFSSKPGVGTPGFFVANEEGKFSYDENLFNFKEMGISYEYENGFFGSSMYGINANGYTGLTPEQVWDDGSAWVDFKTAGHKESLDTLYTMKLSLDALGLSKSDLEQDGIGVMHISIYGSSAVNTIPMDPSCLDVATDAYSADPSSTAEKEDTDNITVPLARVGAPLSSGGPQIKELSANFGAGVSSPQQTGTGIELSADGYNGTAPYTYAFYANDTKIASSGNTATWTPSAEGNYTLKCVVTDAAGSSVTETKSFAISSGGVVTPTEPETEPETKPEPTEYVLGDVTGDERITLDDALLLQSSLVRQTQLDATQKLAADVNKDGSVTLDDLLKIQKFLAKVSDIL